VVSTCEELSYPQLRHPELARQLDSVARQSGGRILGTGVNPGFLMDTFPLLASRITRDIGKVTVYRIQDAATRRIPFQKKIGAGLTVAEFEAKAETGSLRHVGLGESLHFLGDTLGLTFARWHETLGPVLGDDGLATGVRQVAQGLDDDDSVLVELVFQAAIGQDDPHDRVVIAGDPPIDLVWRGGVHGDLATINVLLGSIAPLMAAPPGLHTMATIPLTG
jgi:4-hydroxy-tetrahydrodipicolinate reductase